MGGVLALAVAATFVEAYPVPIEDIASGGVSLTAVFIVGAAVIYGWAPAVMVGFVARATHRDRAAAPRDPARLQQLRSTRLGGGCGRRGGRSRRHPRRRRRALRRGPAGRDRVLRGQHPAHRRDHRPLVAGAVPAASPRTRSDWTASPFAIMASVSLALAVLWEQSPVLAAALAGPLVAVALHQRSTHNALRAMRLALTDPLTGLGNHRHFQEQLQLDLEEAPERGTPLTLCLLDLDNFKQINDRYGHPVGDKVLAQVAARLRQGRRGVPPRRRRVRRSSSRARTSTRRLAIAQLDHRAHGRDGSRARRGVSMSRRRRHVPAARRRAQRARARRRHRALLGEGQGKNRVRVYRPDVIEIARAPAARRGPRPRRAPAARPRASRMPSTPATPTRAATRTWSASSPRASPSASASTRSRSS